MVKSAPLMLPAEPVQEGETLLNDYALYVTVALSWLVPDRRLTPEASR